MLKFTTLRKQYIVMLASQLKMILHMTQKNVKAKNLCTYSITCSQIVELQMFTGTKGTECNRKHEHFKVIFQVIFFFYQYQGLAGRSTNEVLQLYSAHGQQQKLQRSSVVAQLHGAIKVKTFSNNVGIICALNIYMLIEYSKTQKMVRYEPDLWLYCIHSNACNEVQQCLSQLKIYSGFAAIGCKVT